jgi:hypothetical protein
MNKDSVSVSVSVIHFPLLVTGVLM